jgi:hypothetical protein
MMLSRIELVEQRADRGIEFGQREEASMSQSRQDQHPATVSAR